MADRGPIPAGTVLKKWKIGEKLGSGACSDVYAVTPLQPDPKLNCTSYAMKISPLPPPASSAASRKKKKKTNEERNADALYAEQLLYSSAQLYHKGIPQIPLGCYGEDKGYRFFVMERLGRNLSDVVKTHGPIVETVAARLGLDMVYTHPVLYSCGCCIDSRNICSLISLSFCTADE